MKRALIIEDNEDNMKLISFLLEKSGYSTFWAETGYKGVDLTFSDEPDFIILDIQLPDIEGTEVLKIIREREKNKRTPIIAMTSYAMSGDREKLLNAGCDGYIEKPIDPMLVIDQIKEIIGD